MELKYFRSRYAHGDGTAIWATFEGEPYCDVSINLIDYGMMPPDENHIFIPTYKMMAEDIGVIKKDLVAEVIDDDVTIGYGKGILVKLRDDWKEVCVGA